jgi:hypothetical protein
MSTLMELTIVLLVCPAALAAWADARYPNLRPTDLRRTAIHLGVTGVLAFVLLRPLLIGVGLVVPGQAGRAAAIAIACVIITYSLIVTVWVMRSAADLAGIGR